MPTYFVDPNKVDRIEIEGGEWIDIKSKLSIHDQDLLNQRLVEIEKVITSTKRGKGFRNSNNSDVGEITAKFRPSSQALLEIAIVNWSFKDSEGKEIPVTFDNIGRLETWVAHIIEDEVDSRNPLAQEITTQ